MGRSYYPKASVNSLVFFFCRWTFCRLLAREGINAEQLARDLKSFELKVTFFILAVSPYNVLQGLLCVLVCFSLR